MAADDPYDELFSAPVEEFVSRRDALVRQLKADGDKEQAAVVKAWRRPSRVVGALNRLAITDRAAATGFAKAARAVASSRGAKLRAANEHFRASLKDAATAAAGALDEARSSDLGEITNALLTVGGDEAALATFEEGRLLDLPDAGGFGFGLGAAAAPDDEDDEADEKDERERARLQKQVEQTTAALRDAEARAADAKGARDAAAQALADAEDALAAAGRAVDDARRALDAAERDLADFEA
jgi:hypothetical protein